MNAVITYDDGITHLLLGTVLGNLGREGLGAREIPSSGGHLLSLIDRILKGRRPTLTTRASSTPSTRKKAPRPRPAGFRQHH
ncbi:MAG TPA: hypothetical protein VF614_11845 [Chthoniobacteraceae bacterium]